MSEMSELAQQLPHRTGMFRDSTVSQPMRGKKAVRQEGRLYIGTSCCQQLQEAAARTAQERTDGVSSKPFCGKRRSCIEQLGTGSCVFSAQSCIWLDRKRGGNNEFEFTLARRVSAKTSFGEIIPHLTVDFGAIVQSCMFFLWIGTEAG